MKKPTLSPTIAPAAAATITHSIDRWPWLARIPAAISAVSPGSGTPMVSTAMNANRAGTPASLATSANEASTRLAYGRPGVRPDHHRPRRRLARPRRRPAHRPRRGAHARVRPAGDEGDRQGPAVPRG